MAAGALGAAAAAPAARPNILFIMSDQHRAGMTKFSGYPLDTMPTLDRLASRGVSFDRAYCTAPLCVPSRISLLTGRWPHAHRVRENWAIKDAFFEKDIFDVARAAGYKTGLSGKNHSHLTPNKMDFFRPYSHFGGWKPENAPVELVEFDKWLMHLNLGTSDVVTPFPLEAQLPYRIVSSATEFMSSCQDPFLLWVSFPEPHEPYQVPKPYYDMFPPAEVPARAAGPEVLKSKTYKWQWLSKLAEFTYPGYDNQWRRVKSNYLGMLRLIDDQLARLFRFMEDRKILDNTIVVYISDHGDFVGDYGLIRKGVDMPEALTRIPMIWSGPGIQTRQKPPDHVSMADVFPTICEAIGQPTPRGVQGRSLWQMLQGKEYPKEEFRSIYSEVGIGGLYYGRKDKLDFRKAQIVGAPGAILTFDELNYCTQSGYMKMARMGDWKLCFDMMGNGQLYNLAEDPYELRNRYGDPKVARDQIRLMEELLAWNIRIQDTLPTARYETKWAEHNWYWPHRADA
jgi:arylsulfatase A-like enzyme